MNHTDPEAQHTVWETLTWLFNLASMLTLFSALFFFTPLLGSWPEAARPVSIVILTALLATMVSAVTGKLITILGPPGPRTNRHAFRALTVALILLSIAVLTLASSPLMLPR